jgi:hypothetical protein
MEMRRERDGVCARGSSVSAADNRGRMRGGAERGEMRD